MCYKERNKEQGKEENCSRMIANRASIASTNNASVGVEATAGVSAGGGGQSGIGNGGGARGPGKRTRKEPVDKSDATAFAA